MISLLQEVNDYRRKRFLMKWMTFIGAYLLNFWALIAWIWGNLSVYTFSYSRALGLSSSGVAGPWMLSITFISWSIGIMMSEKLMRRVKRRSVAIVSVFVTNGGIFLSFFTVQISPKLLNLTLGAMTGIGTGFLFSIQQLYVIEWTDKYLGLATASVQAISTGSSVFSNAMVTFLINPKNLQPDSFNGHTKYFSQKEVIDRVPMFFLFFGSINLVVNLIGFALIRDKPRDDMMLTMSSEYSEETGCCGTTKYRHEKIDTSDSYYGTQISSNQSQSEYQKSPPSSTDKVNTDDSHDEFNVTPGQALKTPAFYVLAISSMVSDTSFLSLTTYYKTFGSLYIKNDHFLTTIGSLTSLAVATIILVVGATSDRFGLKPTSVSASCLMTVLMAFYFFTPMISKWLFLLFTVVSCGLVFGFYNLAVVCTLRIFGPRHFTTNYGMVTTSSLLINIVIPPVTEFTIVNYGWVCMYFIIAFINFPTLLLIIFGFPRV